MARCGFVMMFTAAELSKHDVWSQLTHSSRC